MSAANWYTSSGAPCSSVMAFAQFFGSRKSSRLNSSAAERPNSGRLTSTPRTQ